MCDWLKLEVPHMDLQLSILRPVASEVKAKEMNVVRTNITALLVAILGLQLPACKRSSGAASLNSTVPRAQYAATGRQASDVTEGSFSGCLESPPGTCSFDM